ncbi:MAG: hypothetical protein ABJB12_07825, partial [Pseudomonadota bacterium]
MAQIFKHLVLGSLFSLGLNFGCGSPDKTGEQQAGAGRSNADAGAVGVAGRGTAGAGEAGSSSTAGQPSGGAASAGSAGASNGGEATAGGASGGSSASAGSAGVAGAVANGDLVPPRALNVTAPKARHETTFRAKDADSSVSFNDNPEVAVLDNRAPTLLGKLVLQFGGVGTNDGTLGGGGEFCARRGFHVLGIAAFQDYDILSFGAAFFGDARREVFEGKEYTRLGAFANIQITPAGGVAQRTQKALAYLHAKYPDQDWGYYLQADGTVRWSDVIFTGFSHGASNAARFAMLVRASRVVSASGPRENLCVRSDQNNCGGVIATWLSETSKTPIDRFFALSGTTDDQHLQHLFAMEKLGYSGAPTSIDGSTPPFGNSHRLTTKA